LETLAAQAHPSGGWGYTAGAEVQIEPTCLALLALNLQSERFAVDLEKGRLALARCMSADGSYRLARGRREAVWPTALVLFVQLALGYPLAEIERTARLVLQFRGRIPEDPRAAELHDIDFQLLGWAWAENNFSWVEPTAWACLALRRAGYGRHPRVQEGLRLLLDRAHDQGGINYGNRQIFDKVTDPIPGPTAVMMFALQGREEHPRMAAAAEYLRQQIATADLEHLCWIKLALNTFQAHVWQPVGLDEQIIKAHQSRSNTAWLPPSPYREALTALALGTDVRNYFLLPAVEDRNDTTDVRPVPPKLPFTERVRSYFRRIAIEAAGNLRPLPPHSAVHIAMAASYTDNLAGVVGRQYESFRERVPMKGKRVVLKPNLVEYHRNKVINTNPAMVAAVIELCRREGAAEVIVAEGPGHWRNVEYLVRESGLGDVLRHYQVPFMDLNHDEPVQCVNPSGLTRLEHLYLARTIVQAEVLISLPKLKTHHWAGATLSLKNLFGTLPGICYGWPKNELHWRGIDNSIVDIALTRMPDLAIVDGIIGMEGDGPLNGTPKHLGVIVMGTDLLAVDATCCRLMQLDPERMGYMILGQRKKLGLLRAEAIQQIGESIASLAQPFEQLPHFQGICVGRSA
jgi:uncharacterized protein (DUF362 family)